MVYRGDIVVPGTIVDMGQSQIWSLCRHLLAVLLVLVIGLNIQSSHAQQLYNGETYYCSDSGKTSCGAFALYRGQTGYTDLTTIAGLFNTRANTLANLNNLTVNGILTIGQPVVIPLTCICYNQTSYANLTRIIVSGDTFYDLNVNQFESLSTTNAVINANPTLDYYDLQIGTPMIFPVRCACPSLAQIAANVTSLVTYPILKEDSTSQIALSFGASTDSVINANNLVGANTVINPQTTLLIPINTSTPHYKAVVFPSTPAPGTGPSAAPTSPSGGHSSSKTGEYVGIALGVSAGVVIFLVAALCLFLVLKRRREKEGKARKTDTEAPLVLEKTGSGGNLNARAASIQDGSNKKGLLGDALAGMADLVGSDRPSLFTYEEVSDATNNFSDSNILQGSVYGGVLNGQVVAIKQMKGNVSQELKILCRVHHSNLIKLVGLCVKEEEHLYLVYEYAENGSLSDCLHTDFLSRNKLSTKSSSYLSWTMRVQIALDSASGLEYIHDYVSPSYVHKDVKSSNILLDSAFRAKIANFAMAKSGGGNDMMTRHIAGTYGYMAPEYLNHGLVTTKADVFAFGVVLLELLSGEEAISEGTGGEERCLYSAIRPILDSPDPVSSLKRWIDPFLSTNYPVDTALSIATLANSCVDPDPVQRPSMKEITFALSNCLNASLEWETSSVFANTLAETPIEAR
ncbi:unnamed protein product [Calypogeia fissa]